MTAHFFASIPADKHDYSYAEGKWTVKEVFMHIIDTERVFAYRALAAARGDDTPVYHMDEELYARNVDVSDRTMADLVQSLKLSVGAASICLKTCVMNRVNVRAML